MVYIRIIQGEVVYSTIKESYTQSWQENKPILAKNSSVVRKVIGQTFWREISRATCRSGICCRGASSYALILRVERLPVAASGSLQQAN